MSQAEGGFSHNGQPQPCTFDFNPLHQLCYKPLILRARPASDKVEDIPTKSDRNAYLEFVALWVSPFRDLLVGELPSTVFAHGMSLLSSREVIK